MNYINGDSRDQFAAEGLIIGVLNLSCAAAIVLLNTRAFDDTPSTGKHVRISPMQHAINALKPFFAPAVSLALFVALWFQIIDIYSRKHGGYRHGMVWRR